MTWQSDNLKRAIGWLASEAHQDLRFIQSRLAQRPDYARLHDQKLARWTLMNHLACHTAAESPTALLRHLTDLENRPHKGACPQVSATYSKAWANEIRRLKDDVTHSLVSRVGAFA